MTIRTQRSAFLVWMFLFLCSSSFICTIRVVPAAAAAFAPLTTAVPTRPRRSSSSSSGTTTATRSLRRLPSQQPLCSSFFDRAHGESDDAFFRRVTAAASDPATFERMVLNDDTNNNKNQQQQQHDSASSSSSLSAGCTNGETGSDPEAAAGATPKKGYVRAEEWEAEEQRRRKNGELTWEERVQFEGQRYGNQVNQNDILRHHLNAFK